MNYEDQNKCKEYLKNTDLICYVGRGTMYLEPDYVCTWSKEGMSKYEWLACFNDRKHIFKVVKKVECKIYPPFEIGTYEPDIAVNFNEFKDLMEKAFKKYENALRVQAERRKKLKEQEMKNAAAQYDANAD